jgi:pyruvate kinase
MGFTAHTPPADACDELIRQLESIRADIVRRSTAEVADLYPVPAHHRPSAVNLLQYLELRNRDLRGLQDELARLGLSSLGRAEAHVMATIDSVLDQLYLANGASRPHPAGPRTGLSYDEGAGRLESNTASLLGSPPVNRRTRIMVTMPAETAEDFLMVHQLLKGGMNCVRINCAHDDADTWRRMIRRLRDADRATGKTCRILMDLGGPKLRTGRMELLPAVIKIRPVRDSHGHVLRPARIWLTARQPQGNEVCAADACLQVSPAWLADCKPGDRVLLTDARDSRRRWRIREVLRDGCWAEARKTSYIINGTVLRLRGYDHETEITALPSKESTIVVRLDDVLILSNSDTPGFACHSRDLS